ncbi:MAG: PD-(D/E)XK nuclease family protein [Candidatus Competibacteraceae bacterium]|nr:PD-(D/E)XK nuclease family protein [Candidatus Competibacteraceae bacterium]
MSSLRNGNPYVWASWITKIITGEESCQWKLWFKSHHTYDKTPSSFDQVTWVTNHTTLLRSRAEELREEGYLVFVEDQNSFRIEGNNGAVISGKPDIVAIRGQDVCVVDCKTGKEKPSDKTQVLIYMLLLPLSEAYKEKVRGAQIRGEIQYQHHRADISTEQVNDEFRTVFRSAMNMAAITNPPHKVPSFGECKYCDITAKDCPEKVENRYSTGRTDIF